MMKNRKNKKGFTLIELLVVIAIIAILAVVVVLTLNPAQLLAESRDSNRLSDFATLKSAIGLYSADVATTSPLGVTGVIDISGGGYLSGVSSTYQWLENGSNTSTSPVASTSWWGFAGNEGVITVTTGTAGTSVGGTGWIPVNLNLISSGAPITALPVDPLNSGTSTVFMFTANGGNYKLATKMESTKYSYGGTGDVESTDGGNSNWTYEAGTSLNAL